MVSVAIFSSEDILELRDRWNELSSLSIRPAFRKTIKKIKYRAE